MPAMLRTFWQEAGARVFELESDRHDQAVANCSHLLHLLAAIIAKQVLGEGDREAHELACAGGFRDSSRIAASDPRMWTEISRHNKDAVLQSLDSFRKHLDDIEGMLKDDKWDDLESYLGDASKLRQDWYTNFVSQRHNEDNNG